MTIQSQLKKYNIGWMGYNFKKYFSDIEFEIPEKCYLKVKKIERFMTAKEILSEFKPKESNLGEALYALKSSILDDKNYNSNIFYMRGNDNKFWAVSFYWSSSHWYWNVAAYPVDDPNGWSSGERFLSSDFGFKESDTSETVKLGNFEPVKIVQIEWQRKQYKLIEE